MFSSGHCIVCWLLCVRTQGGFSEVHLAHDKLTGKTVALKVVFLNKGGLTKDQVGLLTTAVLLSAGLPCAWYGRSNAWGRACLQW